MAGKVGGARAGAGRPKGAKSTRTQEIIAAATAGGITPLEYMLQVMRDPDADLQRRDAMAEKAAKYIHPQLAATTIKGDAENPIELSLRVTFANT